MLQGRHGLVRLALLPGMKALQLLAVCSQARPALGHMHSMFSFHRWCILAVHPHHATQTQVMLDLPKALPTFPWFQIQMWQVVGG